jgi:hypothetical protein
MVTSEREMVRPLLEEAPQEKFTSLQPTYEDTVPPDPDDWEHDDAG